MKIAVLSGKGGTGKTTFSTSLAFISNYTLIDTDIEEPNSHIFLKGKDFTEFSVSTLFPKINMEKCTLCGECGNFCKFNAIIPAKNRVVVFPESCHSCGGCELVCKAQAISWEDRDIGKIFKGNTYFDSKFYYGRLNIGEMSGVKIIKSLHKNIENENSIIDCPPGTSCNTVSALEGIDFAILVTEPSPFGLSDMKLVIELLQEMKIPFGVVINKLDNEENEVNHFCKENSVEIIGSLPFSKEIAQCYAQGKIVVEVLPEYKKNFQEILEKVKNYAS